MKKLLLLISSLFITNFIMAQCVAITGFTVTPPTCFAQANGAVVVTYSAGLAPYVISVIGSSSQTFTTSTLSQSVFGLSADSYNIIITDNNGCQSSQSVNVVEPLPLLTSYNSSPATCGLANGSVTLTIFGGTPNYNIVWNLPWLPTGSMQTNMPSGVWTASVTDAQGCILQQTVSIANPPFPSITSFSATSPSCFGLSNGVLTVNYSNGTAPYVINWSSPIFPSTSVSSALSQSVSGITSGVYSATVTDSFGCSSSQIINVTQPGLFGLIVPFNQTICAGQSTQITATGFGGTLPYTYSWTPNVFVGGGPHTVSPATTTFYTVDITDANGCSPSPKIITVDVNLCSGINEINNSEVSFYPNPTNDLLLIETQEAFNTVEVIDITGKLLLSEKINTTSHVLLMEDVNEGIYFVKLRFNDGRTITKKIMKQ